MDLKEIQKEIKGNGLDGWLFYDFSNRDPISYRILGLDEKEHTSRRWYYFIPREGKPEKLISSVEPGKLESLPGIKHYYHKWEEQHEFLKGMLKGCSKLAMNYSPNNHIPYISMIDLGTGELIRSFGVEIVSAMDLIQIFEGLVKEDAFQTHAEIMPVMHAIIDGAFNKIGERLRSNLKITEYDIQCWMLEKFEANNLIRLGMSPSVAVNGNAALPHFNPALSTSEIKKGDLILIDSWAKKNTTDAICYDVTWMAYSGSTIPSRIQEIWETVRDARDLVISVEKEKIAQQEPCCGWELDQVARDFIEKKGFGKYFRHRTGHSIGRDVHGNAVHLDNYEIKDERKLVPYILHSVEPGIYIPEENIGIRSEVDVYIDGNGDVSVTGPMQKEIVRIEC